MLSREPRSPARWAVRSAVAVSLLIGCGRGSEQAVETPSPIRLVELAASARLTPASAAAALGTADAEERGLGRAADIDALAAGGRVARVLMTSERRGSRDYRLALVAPTGSRYRFDLTLPPAATLRAGLGFAAAAEPAGGELRYAVSVTPASTGGAVSAAQTVLAIDPEQGWEELAVDLGRWSGLEVELTLSVDGPPGCLAAWSSPEIVSAPDRPPATVDVILISLDTLRADCLGSYGYRRPTSPHLDAFAARSVRFTQAISQSPWTRPSHRALFTGLHPQSRGGRVRHPIAEVLWRHGFRTGAITGGGQVDRNFGFDRGFDGYRTQDWLNDDRVVADWLESTAGRRRFLFLHTYEIHDPYTHGELARGLPRGRLGESFAESDWRHLRKRLTDEEQRYVEALYDGGIAYTDRRLGRLLGELERNGSLERAIVVVTSDHGEQFWEHGSWRHGQVVYDHQLRVPLLVYVPPALAAGLGIEPGRVVPRQVRLIDVYPTLLELLGIEPPGRLQGRSLVPLLRGATLPPVEAFAENTNTTWREQKALRSETLKLIRTMPRDPGDPNDAEPRSQLFDLAADPGEKHDLAAERPDLAAALLARITAIMEGANPAELERELPDGVDPALREELEALGYIGN